MGRIRRIASNIGVQALNAVYQPQFHEKIQGAIDGRRLGVAPFIFQDIEKLVSPYRLVTLPDQFKDLAANVCQSRSLLKAQGFRDFQGAFNALAVIVT